MTDSKAQRAGWPLGIIGLVAAIASSLANLALIFLIKPMLRVPGTFAPLTTAPIIFWSFVGAFGAIGVYALIRIWSTTPNRTFVIVAVIVLVLSFIPDLAISGVTTGPFAGATPAAILVLMVMHVISFAIVVPMLWRLARQPTTNPSADPEPGA